MDKTIVNILLESLDLDISNFSKQVIEVEAEYKRIMDESK